uniref:Ovule protein n=1 Tax=Brugia timori TaxID=42155 RepID=A0A0R3QA97_9BILA
LYHLECALHFSIHLERHIPLLRTDQMHCLLIALDHIPYHILTDVTSKTFQSYAKYSPVLFVLRNIYKRDIRLTYQLEKCKLNRKSECDT